jgi:2-amino-4-hydroxy-6-hydroxymethyldihydropteridine diphosphokinase
MALCHVALGSNLGDREGHIGDALIALGRIPNTRVVRRSSLYESAPVGGPVGQGPYLNAVAELETDLEPEEVLRHLQGIEAAGGRVRAEKNGPRTIDLDLLLFGRVTRLSLDLTLPHPRMHERLFVLEPLAELVPGLVHPVLGKTVARMKADLQGQSLAGPGPGRELTGQRVLITGSSGGIGRAIALELAQAGASVLVHGRRKEAVEEVCALARDRGSEARPLLADLATAEGCDTLAAEAWETFGGLDAVINNAGADVLTGDAADWPFDRKLAQLWAVDVQATIRLSRSLGSRMRQASGGTILTMGWDQAERGMEGDSGEMFAAVKGAVMCFTRSLALSLAPEVRAVCLAPGWIRTAWGEGASEAWQLRVARETPLGRWGTPEDVAAVARWLLSPAAAYFHGQTVRINGGAVR